MWLSTLKRFPVLVLAVTLLINLISMGNGILLGVSKRGPLSFLLPTIVGLAVGLLVASFVRTTELQKEEEKRFSLNLAQALAAALEEKDPYTLGHSRRVTGMALRLGERLGLDEKKMEILHLGGILHDIGKIGVPDAILQKPGPLSEREFSVIRDHPANGDRILARIQDDRMRQVCDLVRHHHERYDGKGYPDGLAGDRIPLLARIISLADSYDAKTSDRPYRDGKDVATAIAEIKRCAGSQFDPELAAEFTAMLHALPAGMLCDLFVDCPIFSRIQEKRLSRAYEAQYCRADFSSCARFLARGTSPPDLLPDGGILQVPAEYDRPSHTL